MPQSLAKVYIHLVFSTKNRTPILADDWRDELFHVLGGTANNLDCQSLIVGGVADHVHMLFQLGRTITLADAIGKIKSTSSNWINQSRRIAERIPLAIRLRRIFRKPVNCRIGPRVRSKPAATSRQAIVPRRAPRMVTALRNHLGRKVRVGLKHIERPLQGRVTLRAHFLPRPSTWANRAGRSGRKSAATFTSSLSTRRTAQTSPMVSEPKRLVPPAQGEALGRRSINHATLKGSFILEISRETMVAKNNCGIPAPKVI